LNKTYSLKQVVYDDDPKRKIKVTHYITITNGLTWQQAKDRRKLNRSFNIVPEHNSVKQLDT
jgi:hypothetical protein